MPPRQPLKPARARRVVRRGNPSSLSEVAEQLAQTLLAPVAPNAPSQRAEPPRPPRSGGVSPYPDLSMAIAMLEKRQSHLGQQFGASSERAQLAQKWLSQLKSVHTEMQKLHKLEQLATRLKPKSL